MLKYIFAFCLLATPCFAQQQQVPTVAETAIQINTIVNQWATTLTQQGRLIADLQKQVAEKDAKIKELEEKK